jgi:hypothetical protein
MVFISLNLALKYRILFRPHICCFPTKNNNDVVIVDKTLDKVLYSKYREKSKKYVVFKEYTVTNRRKTLFYRLCPRLNRNFYRVNGSIPRPTSLPEVVGEPLLHSCRHCGKDLKTELSLAKHVRITRHCM